MGIKCTANVTIGEREVDCLLETVPQATTIPQSFYESNLSDFPLKQLENLLEVEGANGQAVPFLGYIELTPKFPNAFLVSEVPTLALVVPDSTSLSQILVGTNSLYVLCSKCAKETAATFQSSFPGYQALSILFCTFYFIAHFYSLLFLIFYPYFLYIFSCVVTFFALSIERT